MIVLKIIKGINYKNYFVNIFKTNFKFLQFSSVKNRRVTSNVGSIHSGVS